MSEAKKMHYGCLTATNSESGWTKDKSNMGGFLKASASLNEIDGKATATTETE
jgi:hypothetical protein